MAVKKDTTAKKKVSKGDAYECGACGMAVVVDEPCTCEDDFALMCCGEPMKEKKSRINSKINAEFGLQTWVADKYTNFLFWNA